MKWLSISTAPRDGTVVLLANYPDRCLLTGAPHVWSARWVTDWKECSYAASNENGEPSHWAPMPEDPDDEEKYR